MATVVKRGKTYTAVYTGAEGKQIWKKAYSDRKESLRLAQRLEDEARKIRMGDTNPEADARRLERGKPVDTHLEAFRAHMQAKARHQNHIDYTIRDCRLCFEFAGVAQANQLTLGHVDRWRVHLLEKGMPDHHKKIKPDTRKTVNRRIASVRAFLRYLMKVGAVDRVVLEGYEMLATKGHETRQRRALTTEEVAALLDKTADPHRRELYRFALLTGFRRSEIASIAPKNIDFKRGTVTVIAKDAKYKGAHQIIPLHSKLVEPLKRLCDGKDVNIPIFAVPRRQAIVQLLHDDCKVAGIATDKVDFHGLRHTFITSLADQNIRPEVLMKLARHRDLATTMRYYVHFRPTDERSALELLGG